MTSVHSEGEKLSVPSGGAGEGRCSWVGVGQGRGDFKEGTAGDREGLSSTKFERIKKLGKAHDCK